jgi:hypothetical protein
MNAIPDASTAQLENENRKLILSLRNELDVLRGTQTATNAVLHAVLATHTEPHHALTAVAQMEAQLGRQSQHWPEQSRQAIASVIATLRTTIDANLKNREAHKAKAAN